MSILSMGYRLRVNTQVEQARIAEAIKLKYEQDRLQTILAKAAADVAELDTDIALADKRRVKAAAETQAFLASSDSLPQSQLRLLLGKWDGKLPGVLVLAPEGYKFAEESVLMWLPSPPAKETPTTFGE